MEKMFKEVMKMTSTKFERLRQDGGITKAYLTKTRSGIYYIWIGQPAVNQKLGIPATFRTGEETTALGYLKDHEFKKAEK